MMTAPIDQTDTAVLQQYKTLEARFDRAAKMYDAAYGPPDENGHGSLLLGHLRQRHLALLSTVFPEGTCLLDIGCGTGEEAIALVQAGYSVLGIDISPLMVRQAQTKAIVHSIRFGLSFRALPAGRLETLDERGPFHGAFASLGTLNTEPDLAGVARGLHTLLVPGARFVATVMSRRCLYEILHNALRLRPGRTLKRKPDWQETRAGSGGVIAPVKFYTPQEFAAPFRPYFEVESVRAFPLWLPPVHLHELYRAHAGRYQRREKWDERMAGWPVLRGWGDHFLMVLRHTARPDAVTDSDSPAESSKPTERGD